MVYIIILVFVGATIVQSYYLIKRHSWRELIVFAILQGCAFTLSLLYTLGFHFPSPIELIDNLITKALNK
jgi:hypothetical protein